MRKEKALHELIGQKLDKTTKALNKTLSSEERESDPNSIETPLFVIST